MTEQKTKAAAEPPIDMDRIIGWVGVVGFIILITWQIVEKTYG